MKRTAPDRPVIADVARVAGVSVPTVSRVLTGSTFVSEERRRLVEDAIRTLDYRPNMAARALRSGHRSTVGVVALDTSRYGYSRTLRGIESAARDAGYVVIIVVVESTAPGEMQAALDVLRDNLVSGVIVIEFDPVAVVFSEQLPATTPLVTVGTAARRGAPGVRAYLDDQAAARVATKHLLDLGHRTVHHLAIPQTTGRVGRRVGWRQALRAAGAEVTPAIQAFYDPASGRSTGRELAADPEVTAVLCGNDELAIGFMRALTEVGRRVPEDVSVVGFDDQPFAAMWSPALTTMRQDFDELGRQAFGLLESTITTGTAPRHQPAEPILVLRESTAPPPVR